jgi:hypothetical protein
MGLWQESSLQPLAARLNFLTFPSTVTQNIRVDPFPEEIRRAGEKFKINVGQKRGNNGATRRFGG